MAYRYLIICECGLKIKVEESQFGLKRQCHCGRIIVASREIAIHIPRWDEVFDKRRVKAVLPDPKDVSAMIKPVSLRAAKRQIPVDDAIPLDALEGPGTGGAVPPEAKKLFREAEEALHAQRWVHAVKSYEQGLKKHEPAPMAWRHYGAALEKMGRFADAEKALRKAIELKPDFAAAYDDLGLLMARDRGALDEAEKMFLKALEIDPRCGAAGNLEVLRKQREETRVRRPEDERLSMSRTKEADRWEAQGEFARALNIYLEFLETHPRSVMTLGRAAELYLKMNQIKPASRLWERAVEYKPADIEAWKSLGAVRISLGDKPGARKAFEAILALDPSNAAASARLKELAGHGSRPR